MQKNILDKQRLIQCREKLGITKQEAARRMRMSQPAYLRYEAGDRIPSIHIIETMANVLGTSVEFLTGETQDASPRHCLIEAALEPELFLILDTYNKSGPEDRNRLLEYAKNLYQNRKTDIS
ncbi:MAG: helix-turn-helix transcriptional regulator [Clostridiales bacterium]|nr:helix-turn-helix transcriptional regulator [Clostridiales bacterium]